MKRWLVLLFMLLATAAQARIETHLFKTQDEEARYLTLTEELRCLVCQNQNLADSNAELAQDLRKQIYQMIEEGKSNAAITDYMVHRYGDFVLYRPPLRPTTLLLWCGPFIILMLGVFLLLRFVRADSTPIEDEPDTDEIMRARKLLQPEQEETPL
jgi:cytochrome c-type biogenesis protein CcmH